MTIHTKALLVAAAVAVNGATVKANIMPFSVGASVLAMITMNGFTGTVKIQSSEDDSAWTDVETVTESTSDRTVNVNVKLGSYVRAIVSARSAGDVSVMLQG